MNFQVTILNDFVKALKRHERWLVHLNKQKKICNCSVCCYFNMCKDKMDPHKNQCKLQNVLKTQMEVILGFSVDNLKYELDDWE